MKNSDSSGLLMLYKKRNEWTCFITSKMSRPPQHEDTHPKSLSVLFSAGVSRAVMPAVECLRSLVD